MYLSIDIQPEYLTGFSHWLPSWVRWINQRRSPVLFLYNGAELGFPPEHQYKSWLIEIGVSENIVQTSKFFDKGYAFFRDFMDMGMCHENIVKIALHMVKYGVNDSRDLEEDYIQDNYDFNHGGCSIYIPEVYESVIKNLSNTGKIVIFGGGRYECLKEVELLLQIANKPYKLLEQWIY